MMMNVIGFMEHGGPEVLKIIKIEKPVPEKNQVLIKVQGVSVNYADILTRRGTYHAGGTIFPVVPGLDAMGIVEKVGSQVTHIKEGQRVIAFPHTGTYADYVIADSNLVFPIPDGVNFEQAVACPIASFTAHMVLNQIANLNKGETLLVHGAAGGLGTTAIQIAKSMDVKVIGTVRRTEQISEALQVGADYVVNNKTEDFVDRVNEITKGKGADVILDPLGGTFTSNGMKCLASYGRMVILNNSSGPYSHIDTGLLHGSCRSVLGFSIGTTRKLRPQWFANTAVSVIELMVSEKISMQVSKKFNLSEANKAHELMENNKLAGKIILKAE